MKSKETWWLILLKCKNYSSFFRYKAMNFIGISKYLTKYLIALFD